MREGLGEVVGWYRRGCGNNVGIMWGWVTVIWGECKKMQKKCKKMQKLLHMSKKSSTFASDLGIVPTTTI